MLVLFETIYAVAIDKNKHCQMIYFFQKLSGFPEWLGVNLGKNNGESIRR